MDSRILDHNSTDSMENIQDSQPFKERQDGSSFPASALFSSSSSTSSDAKSIETKGPRDPATIVSSSSSGSSIKHESQSSKQLSSSSPETTCSSCTYVGTTNHHTAAPRKKERSEETIPSHILFPFQDQTMSLPKPSTSASVMSSSTSSSMKLAKRVNNNNTIYADDKTPLASNVSRLAQRQQLEDQEDEGIGLGLSLTADVHSPCRNAPIQDDTSAPSSCAPSETKGRVVNEDPHDALTAVPPSVLHHALERGAPAHVIHCLLRLNPSAAIEPVVYASTQEPGAKKGDGSTGIARKGSTSANKNQMVSKTAMQVAFEHRASREVIHEIARVISFVQNKTSDDDEEATTSDMSQRTDSSGITDPTSKGSTSKGRMENWQLTKRFFPEKTRRASQSDASSSSTTASSKRPSQSYDALRRPAAAASKEDEQEFLNLKRLTSVIYKSQRRQVQDRKEIMYSLRLMEDKQQAKLRQTEQSLTGTIDRRIRKCREEVETHNGTVVQNVDQSLRTWVREECYTPLLQTVAANEEYVHAMLCSVDQHLASMSSEVRRQNRDHGQLAVELERRVADLEHQMDVVMRAQVALRQCPQDSGSHCKVRKKGTRVNASSTKIDHSCDLEDIPIVQRLTSKSDSFWDSGDWEFNFGQLNETATTGESFLDETMCVNGPQKDVATQDLSSADAKKSPGFCCLSRLGILCVPSARQVVNGVSRQVHETRRALRFRRKGFVKFYC